MAAGREQFLQGAEQKSHIIQELWVTHGRPHWVEAF